MRIKLYDLPEADNTGPIPRSNALAAYRGHLLDAAWNLIHGEPSGGDVPTWTVKVDPTGNTLDVDLIQSDPETGKQLLGQLGDAYRNRLRNAVIEAQDEARQAVAMIEDQLVQLEADLGDATRKLDELRAETGESDPWSVRSGIQAELDESRLRFDSMRAQLDEARSRRDVLIDTPPTLTAADALERERLIAEDIELQQDIAELGVRLATIRAGMLDVWRSSAPVLDELGIAAEKLAKSAAAFAAEHTPDALDAGGSTGHDDFAPFRKAVDEYATRLEAFSQTWSVDFLQLRKDDVDPLKPRPLQVQERTQRRLDDFLYESGEALSRLRTAAREISQISDTSTFRLSSRSELVRMVERLQTLHHEFEFAAAPVRTTEDFRLAAEVRSAAGLLHRARKRKEEIDAGILANQQRTARTRHTLAIAAIQEEIDDIRMQMESEIDEMLAIQDRAAEASRFVDEAMVDYTAVKIGEQRVADLMNNIAATRRRLIEASNQRPPLLVSPDRIAVASIGFDTTPVNLKPRMALAWASACTAMLLLIMFDRVVRSARAL